MDDRITKFDKDGAIPEPIGLLSDVSSSIIWDKELINIWSQPQVKAAAENDKLFLPPPSVREGYYQDRHLEYWLSGYLDKSKLMEAVGLEDVSSLEYMDFGGSSGRVARHFVGGKCAPWCCDINIRTVNWTSRYLSPSIFIFQNRPFPYLPLEDRTFDIISAFSVFTHIDIGEIAWLLELRRVLRPGGYLYLTVHDEFTWEAIKNMPWKIEQLSAGGNSQALRTALDHPIPNGRWALKYHEEGIYDVNIFYSTEYLRRRWGAFFSEFKHFPLRHGETQSAVVLRK